MQLQSPLLVALGEYLSLGTVQILVKRLQTPGQHVGMVNVSLRLSGHIEPESEAEPDGAGH